MCEDEADKVDELLNEGLRSNGPFYGFGALLSHALVENGGTSSLGVALGHGAPWFVERGLSLLGNASLVPGEGLSAHIARLRAELKRGTQHKAQGS